MLNWFSNIIENFNFFEKIEIIKTIVIIVIANMERPKIGEIHKNHDFTVKVIDGWNDPKNKNTDGSYKRRPTETNVIYEYLSEPVGKIGRCHCPEGFYSCFGIRQVEDLAQ